MKILIVMDPGILIPVKNYGGHERLVEMFAKEYHRLGHTVHLLITTGSKVEGCIVHDFGKEGFPPKKADAMKAIPFAWKFILKYRNYFDLIHNFGRLAYLLPVLRHPVKKIMSYGREIDSKNAGWVNRLGGVNFVFTACSSNLLSRVNVVGDWEVVHNAINFAAFNCVDKLPDDAPLIFFGRLERIKGCHTAIAIAKACGRKLVIAGNVSPLIEEKAYYENEIAPLVDGEQVKYIGALNDIQKNEWLGKSMALLFPIEWSEPFGMVMIEAMACGTPVIAFNRGSVNEVVQENITGFKVNSVSEMIEAVGKIKTIDRPSCRSHAQNKFDSSVITSRYLDLFKSKAAKIVIVTTGQPSANPRVMKEYATLKEKGYKVKVLYTYSAEWSYKIDEEKFRTGELAKQDFILVGGDPFSNKIVYNFSLFCFKLFRKLSSLIPLFFLQDISIARSSLYLWLHAKKYRADIYIAHYLGALPAVIKASGRYQAVAVFDAEDFHRGEVIDDPIQVRNIIETEDRLLPRVDLITAASFLISKSYQQLYPEKKIITINNVFSKKYLQYANSDLPQEIKLFWFSQNIGPNRGLEVIIDALNRLEENVSLTLMGILQNSKYIQQLLKMSKFPERIHVTRPVKPEEIFQIASGFDIGLAAEIACCRNRDICLTNKIFTYLLAGNCILASDTKAQKEFLHTYPAIGLLYQQNNAADLSAQIRRLNEDRILLMKCKASSSELALQVLNWESESEKLINAIESLLKPYQLKNNII